MIYYTNFDNIPINIVGSRKKIDNNIFTLDFETTSSIEINGKIYNNLKYDELDDKQKENVIYHANMYIWMLGINDIIYYGRTYEELDEFLNIIDKQNEYKKTIFVHNLAFEFHFMQGYFDFIKVQARKSHKVMKCTFEKYNIDLRCTYFMSNTSLDKLSDDYNLKTKKLIGNLNYNILRNSKTKLSNKELSYCENDCLILYEYIQKELEDYDRVDKIPLTSTGHVRRELRDIVQTDFHYKRLTRKAINTNPYVYNMLLDAFMRWIYT